RCRGSAERRCRLSSVPPREIRSRLPARARERPRHGPFPFAKGWQIYRLARGPRPSDDRPEGIFREWRESRSLQHGRAKHEPWMHIYTFGRAAATFLWSRWSRHILKNLLSADYGMSD